MPAAWEIPQTPQISEAKKTVAVCIPHSGNMSSEFCHQLRELSLPLGSQIFMARGYPLDVTREMMVNDALKNGFEWIFFLDSDIILPPRAIETLLSANLPIVNGIYRAKKNDGFTWAAWKYMESNGKKGFVPIASWTGRYFHIDVIGTGCMLIHRKVFETIREKYPKLPLFFWCSNRCLGVLDALNLPDPRMREVSEDFYFCLLAQQCGFQVVVDGDVKCGHLATVKIMEDGVKMSSV